MQTNTFNVTCEIILQYLEMRIQCIHTFLYKNYTIPFVPFGKFSYGEDFGERLRGNRDRYKNAIQLAELLLYRN